MGLYLPDSRFEVPELLHPLRKPTGPAQINRADPLARGLLLAWLIDGDTARELVRGRAEKNVGNYDADWLAGKYGRGAWINSNLSGEMLQYANPEIQTGPAWSVSTACYTNRNYGAGINVCGLNSVAANRPSNVYLKNHPTTGYFRIYTRDGGGYVAATSTTGLLQYQTWHTLGGSFATDDNSVFIDGVERGTAGNSPSIIDTSVADYQYLTVYNNHGVFPYYYLWNRRLSNAEHAQIHANPYRFVIPA